jgi:hypothetical protein
MAWAQAYHRLLRSLRPQHAAALLSAQGQICAQSWLLTAAAQ